MCDSCCIARVELLVPAIHSPWYIDIEQPAAGRNGNYVCMGWLHDEAQLRRFVNVGCGLEALA